MIQFTIPGKPIALKRHRPSARGGMYDPSSKDKKQTWLQIAKYKPKRPIAGDVYLKLIFYMPRPKHHYRTGKYKHLLKDSYKDIIYHSVVPDLDNLVKFICDLLGMNKGFYIDVMEGEVMELDINTLYGKGKKRRNNGSK